MADERFFDWDGVPYRWPADGSPQRLTRAGWAVVRDPEFLPQATQISREDFDRLCKEWLAAVEKSATPNRKAYLTQEQFGTPAKLEDTASRLLSIFSIFISFRC